MLKKILIVENERLIGKLLAKTLKSSGYQICDVVASGEEAVAIAKKAGKINRSALIDKFDNLHEIQKAIEIAVS